MPYTIKPGSFKYKKSNGQFSEIDCFEGPDLTEEVAALEKSKAPIIIDSAIGNPIVIKDGADSLPVEGMKIHFSPVQSGTGDPSPSNIRPISGWTGVNAYRAGKNLFDPAKTDRISTIYNIRVYKNDPILLPAGTYTMSCSEECNGLYVEQGASDIFTKYNSTFLTFTLDKATKVSFNFYMVNAFASDTVVQLEVGSIATPYTPYTGISCPVMFPALGKNLLPNKKCISGDNIFFGTDETKSPYINVHSITLSPGTYTVSVETQDTSLTNLYVAEVGNSSTIALQYNTKTLTFTISKTTDLRIWAYKNGYGQIGTGAITSFQLETGDTATTYEPYKFIYKGTLNLITGVLTITHILWTRNTADMNNESDYPGWKNAGIRDIIGLEQGGAINSITNIGTVFAVNTRNANDIIYLPKSEYVMDQDAWKALAIDVQLIVPLATPYEIQLDPVTVTTLLGDNIIWSNANGDIELDYRADTKLFVDQNNPVTDVQVKGTSLVQNGIADIPLAQMNIPGLMMVGSGYGLKAADINGNSAGRVQIDQATSSYIKGFSDQYRPITPKYLSEAVFQGLAKAAGDTTQAASSNAIGTFTPEAIVAIQKMLGVYQAPWELIREDSFTNDLTTASDHIITVDSNGQPFELTDVLMLFELPQNENTAEKGYYGQIWFYYETDSVIAPEPGSASRAANGYSQGAWYMINYSNKIVTTQSTIFTTNTNSMYWRARYIQYMNNGANSNMGMFVTNDFAINKINIKQVKGEGHYKLYGRRKWTT